jgi:hypothetical protein
MTSLLGYLVERSVRGQPQAATAAAPGAGAESQGSEQSFDLSRGAIRPRIRSRHERRPEFNPPDSGGLTPMEETRERLQTRATAEHQAEKAASGPITADPDLQDGLQRRGDEQHHASRIAVISSRHAVAEDAPARRPRSETPDLAERATTVDAQQSRSDRGDGNVRDTPVARARDWTPPASTVSEPAEPVQPAAKPIKATPAAPRREPDPQEDRSTGAVARPRRQQTEERPSAAAKSATSKESRPARQPLQSPQILALQPAFERPAAPRIEVNIGRVEVRAVYAPPPPSRRAPSSPSMSLDDYLKQRGEAG